MRCMRRVYASGRTRAPSPTSHVCQRAPRALLLIHQLAKGVNQRCRPLRRGQKAAQEGDRHRTIAAAAAGSQAGRWCEGQHNGVRA